MEPVVMVSSSMKESRPVRMDATFQEGCAAPHVPFSAHTLPLFHEPLASPLKLHASLALMPG
jgi:hypothetical protein